MYLITMFLFAVALVIGYVVLAFVASCVYALACWTRRKLFPPVDNRFPHGTPLPPGTAQLGEDLNIYYTK